MEYPEKTTDLLQVTDKLYHMYDYILLINNYIYYFVVGSERGSPSEPDGNVDVATLAEAMLDQSPSNSVHSNQDQESHDGAQQNLSSLELENKLLKNEVTGFFFYFYHLYMWPCLRSTTKKYTTQMDVNYQ
jgi:hypothetical protein